MQQQLKNYLMEVQLIAQKNCESVPPCDKAVEYIDQQSWATDNPPFSHFLKGERSFYSGDYELAIEHYLDAKEIPDIQFYCYRATILLLNSLGDVAQARELSNIAFQIKPADPSIFAILAKIQADNVNAENKQNFVPNVPSTESAMNNSSNIFSAIINAEATNSDLLKERLYGSNEDVNLTIDQQNALNELRKLAGADIKNETYKPWISEEQSTSSPLEESIQRFRKKHAEQIQEYLNQTKNRITLPDHHLYILNGWKFEQQFYKPFSEISNPTLLTEASRKSLGGHYIRWNGKGIVINPGPGFINIFHEQGLCVSDIDFVIVTSHHPDAYADVKNISELNSQLNKTSSELQIIHYYLHHKVRQELAGLLKPSFKQARHTIHNLEMFLDSPDVEEIELSEGISLNYFQCTTSDNFGSKTHDSHHAGDSSLGIRLELTDHSKNVRIGYLSKMGWSPLIAHHLSHCDLLIVGFGNTNPRDYSKLGYTENHLGYYGCYSLFEEVTPKLMLLTEFGGREGDIRLDIIKKMRQEFLALNKKQFKFTPVVLPADIGLLLDLHLLQIKCSMSDENVPVEALRVVSSSEDFGRLNYVSPAYFI